MRINTTGTGDTKERDKQASREEKEPLEVRVRTRAGSLGMEAGRGGRGWRLLWLVHNFRVGGLFSHG